MSQERTEPYFLEFDEAEQLFLKFFVENSTHTLTVRGQQEALADLLTARREIDRLNAVNAELEKATLAHMDYIRVIEPAKEAWKKRAKVYRHEMYEGKSKSRYEIDCLMSKVQELDREVERLRAGITAAIEKADWAESDDNEFPRLGYLEVKDILRAALKGAE